MAVFHFALTVIPQVALGASPAPRLTDAELEAGYDISTGFWSSQPPTNDTLAALRSLLPRDRSWGDVEEYLENGNEGSDLRIWSNEEGRVWAITFRFSALTENWTLMTAFLSVLRRAQCWLVDLRTGSVFPPEEEVVRLRYRDSRARQFRTNPAAALAAAAEALTDPKRR